MREVVIASFTEHQRFAKTAVLVHGQDSRSPGHFWPRKVYCNETNRKTNQSRRQDILDRPRRESLVVLSRTVRGRSRGEGLCAAYKQRSMEGAAARGEGAEGVSSGRYRRLKPPWGPSRGRAPRSSSGARAMTARSRLPNRRQCESFEFRHALTKDHDGSATTVLGAALDKLAEQAP
jgi:hypothetical protein